MYRNRARRGAKLLADPGEVAKATRTDSNSFDLIFGNLWGRVLGEPAVDAGYVGQCAFGPG